jgi:uncharacterized protein YbaP (TraB family)
MPPTSPQIAPLRATLVAAALALSLASFAHAQETPPTPPSEATPPTTSELETVVVTGEQPGPGLWKVTSGDHVMWILGTLSPLPKDIHWQPKEVLDAIASAQAVLDPPRVKLKADIGFFGKLRLLPSLVGVRDNPDHKTLQDVVPSDLYARWIALKTKYMGAGRGKNLETWRPIFAAIELWNAAIAKAGLTRDDITGDIVHDAAKRAGIAPTSPRYTVEVEDPHAAVQQFKKGEMDDLDCFRKTLDRIDSETSAMTARANAWATGDIATLRRMPDSEQRESCIAAVTESDIARERGITDLPARIENAWLDAASAALATNRATFARLQIADLLAPDGFVAKLRAKGFKVEAPDEVADSPSEVATDESKPDATKH